MPVIPSGEHLVEVKTTVASTLYYGNTILYVLPKLTITPESERDSNGGNQEVLSILCIGFSTFVLLDMSAML